MGQGDARFKGFITAWKGSLRAAGIWAIFEGFIIVAAGRFFCTTHLRSLGVSQLKEGGSRGGAKES